LRATVPASLVANAGTAAVTVLTPGAPESTSRTFTILSALSITTPSPLPNGTVGVSYSFRMEATGGTLPYRNWRVVEGALPQGLTLNASTGVISGTPTVAGSDFAQISVDDSGNQGTSRVLNWTVVVPPLSITTGSPLPTGTVGVAYSRTLVGEGGTLPYTWSVGAGMPPGLSFSATGVLTGTPTQAGSFTFSVLVIDAASGSALTPFAITILAPQLSITTSSLPAGTVNVAYPLTTLAATGGTPPYSWSVGSGMPPGLALSAAGVLTGTPTQGGTFTFTVAATDAAGLTRSKPFTITVSAAAPTPSITDIPANPGQQPSFNVQLGSAYSLDISGTVTLTFAPDSGLPNDPMIVFSNGTRTLDFTIAAGSTLSPASLQTGTVAGRIDLTITRLVAAGQSILPSPAPVRSIQVARAAPKINSVQVVRTSGGFNVLVTGYSTPRQVTQATFSFTGASGSNLQTTQLTVSLDSAFTTWYGGTTSAQFGSGFLYTQPFQVSGNTSAIASVSVTLSNATGSSSPVSAAF